MRLGTTLKTLALSSLGMVILGCSQNRITQVRIIEPSYSYVDHQDQSQASIESQTLAKVPYTEQPMQP